MYVSHDVWPSFENRGARHRMVRRKQSCRVSSVVDCVGTDMFSVELGGSEALPGRKGRGGSCLPGRRQLPSWSEAAFLVGRDAAAALLSQVRREGRGGARAAGGGPESFAREPGTSQKMMKTNLAMARTRR